MPPTIDKAKTDAGLVYYEAMSLAWVSRNAGRDHAERAFHVLMAQATKTYGMIVARACLLKPEELPEERCRVIARAERVYQETLVVAWKSRQNATNLTAIDYCTAEERAAKTYGEAVNRVMSAEEKEYFWAAVLKRCSPGWV